MACLKVFMFSHKELILLSGMRSMCIWRKSVFLRRSTNSAIDLSKSSWSNSLVVMVVSVMDSGVETVGVEYGVEHHRRCYAAATHLAQHILCMCGLDDRSSCSKLHWCRCDIGMADLSLCHSHRMWFQWILVVQDQAGRRLVGGRET